MRRHRRWMNSEAEGERAFIKGINFANSSQEGILFGQNELENAIVENCTFDEMELEDYSFKNAVLKNSSFDNAILIGVDFSGADLENVDFSNTNLKYANLIGAKNLDTVNFKGALICRAQISLNDITMAQLGQCPYNPELHKMIEAKHYLLYHRGAKH